MLDANENLNETAQTFYPSHIQNNNKENKNIQQQQQMNKMRVNCMASI